MYEDLERIGLSPSRSREHAEQPQARSMREVLAELLAPYQSQMPELRLVLLDLP